MTWVHLGTVLLALLAGSSNYRSSRRGEREWVGTPRRWRVPRVETRFGAVEFGVSVSIPKPLKRQRRSRHHLEHRFSLKRIEVGLVCR